MISTLDFNNFKSLRNVSLNLSNLNVITGINGVGKSSVIQGLLLLRQSYIRHRFANGISLDGELTGNLGSIRDIENTRSNLGYISIGINESNFKFETEGRRDETFLKGEIDIKSIEKSAIFSVNKFQYISASRVSPESQYRKDTYNIENKQFGKNGEFVVAYIAEYGKRTFDKETNAEHSSTINLEVGENNTILPLENQINYWLNHVAKNVRLGIIRTTSTKYELNFEFFNGTSWDSHTATNSAFGLTYSLPVITALLVASPGDLVIIENPESDLHPQAQSKLGELIARCANEGVQIIVETHSDHIINGIRVAISNKPSLLESDKVKIYYFYREIENLDVIFRQVPVDEHGRMPTKQLKAEGIEGFFDQIDTDYKTLYYNAKV